MTSHQGRRFWLVLVVALAVASPLATLGALPRLVAAERMSDLAPAVPESVGVSSERLQRLERFMKGMVDDNRLAGIVTMLARRGKVVHVASAGKKDVRRADPVARDSIFRIYSMTKPITGLAMMMLYEEGKWRLDDPVSRYIPEFAKLQVHVGEHPDGSLKLEDARRPMTMRELMTHTAGLGYGLGNVNPVDRLFRSTRVLDSGKPLQAMIDGMAQIPLLAQPGTRWAYSASVDVQGYLVEKLSGQPFDEFLRLRMFEPLGMKDTAFYVPAEKLSRLAIVHTEGPNGTLTPDENRPNPVVKPVGPSGGGGLFSTIDDYMRFCQMLLDGGQLNGTRLVAPRTVEMMRTNHVNPEALKTMAPGTGWGMDFRVVLDPAVAGEPSSPGSFDWFGIAGTWFWIDPVEDFAFIGMIQHTGRSAADVRLLSRNLVYQALID